MEIYLTPEVLAAVLAVMLAVVFTKVLQGNSELKNQLKSAQVEIRRLLDAINCGRCCLYCSSIALVTKLRVA